MVTSGRARLAAVVAVAAVPLALVAVVAAPATAPARAAQDPVSCQSSVALQNGGFEQPLVGDHESAQLLDRDVPGWSTTASDGRIEIWHDTHKGVPPGTGTQHAELNAGQASTLFQDVATTPGQALRWQLQHRGRAGVDTMQVLIGAPDGTLAGQGPLTDGTSAWGTHSGVYAVPAGQTVTRFAFQSVSTATGEQSVGNFLDGISFGTGACVVTTRTVTTPSGLPRARVGDVLTVTVTSANGGGNPAGATVMTDTLPAGVSYVGGSLRVVTGLTTAPRTDAAGDDTGEYDPATRTVTGRMGFGSNATTGGSLPPGEVHSWAYQVRVVSSAALTTLTSDSRTAYTDPLGARALTSTSDESSTAVEAAADLAVAVTQDTPAVAGEQVRYTAGLTQQGPSAAPATELTARLAPGLTGVTASAPGGSCTVGGDASAGQQVRCTFGQLPPAAARTVTFSGWVPAGLLPGTPLGVSATAGSGAYDHVPVNSGAAVTGSSTASADLHVDLVAPAGTPVAGADTTYTATLHNDGPSRARGVRLSVARPAGSTDPRVTLAGGTCSVAANGTVECVLPELGPGVTSPLSVTVRLDSGSPAVDSSVSVTATTPDPDPTDNTDSVHSVGAARADLGVSLAIGRAEGFPGEQTTYTLTLVNSGPSTARDVAFTTVVPPGISLVRAANPSCTPSACTVPVLPVGTYTFTGDAVVAPDAEEGAGQATTTVTSSTEDLVPGNDTASVAFTLLLEADVRVSQTVTGGGSGVPVVAGSRLLSTVVVANDGPTRAEGPETRQTLSPGQRVPVVRTNRGGCAFVGDVVGGVAVEGGTFVCTLDRLAARTGSSTGADDWVVEFDTVLRASWPDSTLTRLRTVRTASPDPDAADDVHTLSVPVLRQADLSVTQTTPTPTVTAGEEVRFRVIVTNDGPSDAGPVLVREELSPGITHTGGSTTTGSLSPAGGTWSLPGLVVGQSAVLDVTGTTYLSGSIANTARVLAAADPDPDPADDVSTRPVTVLPGERWLSLTSTPTVAAAAGRGGARVGDLVGHSYLVTNDGRTAMQDVLVSDDLAGPASCPATSLAVGESMTCTADRAVRVRQYDVDEGRGLLSSVRATGRAPDGTPTLAFGPAVATTPVVAAAPVLAVTAVASRAGVAPEAALVAGQVVDRVAVVVNTGNLTALDLRGAASPATAVTCPPAPLAPGEATVCTYAPAPVTAGDAALGTTTSTATVTAGDLRHGPPTIGTSAAEVVPAPPAPALLVTVAGEVGTPGHADAADLGDGVAWRHTVHNAGNVPVTGLSTTSPQAGTSTCLPATLPPGRSATCTGGRTTTVGEADIAAAGVADSAVAAGTAAHDGSPVRSPAGTATVVTADPQAAISVTTRYATAGTAPDTAGTTVAAGQGGLAWTVQVGDPLEVHYTVRNGSNVTLAVSVTDPASGSVTCAAAVLPPLAETACRADDPHLVTAAELAAGQVTNLATAAGTPPPGLGLGSVLSRATTTVLVVAAPDPEPPTGPPPAPPTGPPSAPPTGPPPAGTPPQAPPGLSVPPGTPAPPRTATGPATAPPAVGALPVTGASPGEPLLLGSSLVLLGLVVLLRSRRRTVR